ncbi:hypothetical protein SKAU_G00416550 [Synaphobranchus kaupii]|uniref:Reverse transcriptase domain-containing protein n=1 Tax=Synaphobranchus kaupii TaxID=118154 RepID=A0A9Q1IAR8_SYNKA|nr:hypothetical protein SKAU_G00416550 [Synaphobranchus kaupii]
MVVNEVAGHSKCTATAGQTLGTKSQVSNHRAEGSNAADGRQEAEGPVVESSPLESGTENTPGTPTINNQQASQRREKKEPGRRQAIKWPKANEPAVWQKLDNDITVLLEHSLRGRVETKLNSLGDILKEGGKGRSSSEKQWRKASQEEKEGLKPLWEEVRKSLSNLRRAERIRQRRRRKEKERSNFFKNPFKHAKQLLEDKRSGKLEITKPELEKHIREQYSDPAKAIPLGSPGYVPRPAPPVIPFNTAPPKLSEVADVVRKARAASAPGPNGVPYKLYKYCPGVRKILWKLLKVAWGKNIIPSEWQRAVTVFIPKEQNSNSISQFRSIALLNVEGKIFFSIMAKRLTSYLTSNSYIDTSCQKAGVPGFPGCVEHSAVLWEQIQRARREKSDLHVMWLDLANAYGSVPHRLINFALEFFHTPNCIKDLVAKYFADLQMCCAHQDFTTGWQQLEVGIAMGCSISPILFIAAFEIILIGARKMAGGVKMPSGQRLPPLRGFMDDVTTILQTAACTTRLLKRMDELVGWARMKIKPSKSRSLSLRKGVRNDHTIFTAGGEEIPLLSKQPIRSLGRSYTAELSDKQVGEAVRKQLADGLARIHRSQLPGKYKVWCYQHVLYHRVMWPLKMSEVPSSTASKLDGLANSFIRKWLGLPRCLSDVGLFGRNTLQLPLHSISLGYKQEKARMVLELRESSDHLVRAAGTQVRTGRRWKAEEEVDQAIGRLKHREVVGRVQVGRAGLGRSETPLFWSKASKRERKAMVVTEVARSEQERYTIKAVRQSRQGGWSSWEGIMDRPMTWPDLWKIPQARISFLIRATYNTLPCPQNLHLWFGTEEICPLCNTINASLQHILSGCKTALSQGRYRWRHDAVLKKLAEVAESCRREANSRPAAPARHTIQFARAGENINAPRPSNMGRLLSPGSEWNMKVDLGRQLQFPREIAETSLRPDMVLWSVACKTVLLVELTVPWEGGLETAHERKRAKYSDLAAECREAGWKATICPVEVGCRGFVGSSTFRLLRDLGCTGAGHRRASKELAEEAEKGSFWLWLRRKDTSWGPCNT